MMKRIAYLLHRFPAITDTFIKREIRSLQKLGTEVRIISIWKPGEFETTAGEIVLWSPDTDFILPRSIFSIVWSLIAFFIRSPVRLLTTFMFAISTARPGVGGCAYQIIYFIEAILAAEVLKRHGVAHVHNHIGDQSGTVTMLAAKLAGIDYSITFHGWPVFFDAKYSRIKEKVRNAKFTRAISYFCQSQLMMFSESYDLSLFEVVHCGLNIDKYRYCAPRKDIKRILCVARLSPEKGHAFLIHALKLLIEGGHELELLLAGDGPSKENLKTLAGDLGISDRVIFLGFLNEDEVIQKLQGSDLFVLPSFVEGVPVCVMEAMAIGVPVIATNIGGTSELVDDGKNGLLVRPADAEVLAGAIVKMSDDYEFRLRAAELARRKIVDEFDVDKETEKLNNYLLQARP